MIYLEKQKLDFQFSKNQNKYLRVANVVHYERAEFPVQNTLYSMLNKNDKSVVLLFLLSLKYKVFRIEYLRG
jgi:hypothetical protein